MMIGSAVVAVGAVFHAEGGEFCTHFRPNSKNCLYKTGETAVVEVSFADKAGNSLKSGVVDVWADDGWTRSGGFMNAANDAARAAMESRSDERSSRAEEKAAGTTPELRKAVAAQLRGRGEYDKIST